MGYFLSLSLRFFPAVIGGGKYVNLAKPFSHPSLHGFPSDNKK